METDPQSENKGLSPQNPDGSVEQITEKHDVNKESELAGEHTQNPGSDIVKEDHSVSESQDAGTEVPTTEIIKDNENVVAESVQDSTKEADGKETVIEPAKESDTMETNPDIPENLQQFEGVEPANKPANQEEAMECSGTEGNTSTQDPAQPTPNLDLNLSSSSVLMALEKSGLQLLADEYDSDDSEDSVIDTTDLVGNEYRQNVVEIDSDSSSSDESEIEFVSQTKGPAKPINLADDDDDDEDNTGNPKKPPRVKGELLLEDLPPIQDLHITVPETECVDVGKIDSIVEQLVIVKSHPRAILLDLETVLFLEKGQKVLGTIFDVLGQVSEPMYCVRFNSQKQIKERGIEVGQTVYAAPKTEHAQLIILGNLMKNKGSDASWENDIEPPEKYLDYSDDEEEREARRSMRNKDRPTDHNDPNKKARTNAPPAMLDQYNAIPTTARYRNNNQRPQQRPRHPGQGQRNHQGFNYNNQGNTWHSNFYGNQYGASPQLGQFPAPYSNYNTPPPPNYNTSYPPPLMQQPANVPYPYQTPPPAGSYQQYPAAPQADGNFVVNPYAINRQMYPQPPPPPNQ